MVLGASVIRVFEKGTTDILSPILSDLNLDSLQEIYSQDSFSKWFDTQVDKVASGIKRLNAENHRINPGLQWGHATKIVALFVRDMVLSSRYFDDAELKRISYFLHVPIDGIVIERLKKLCVSLPFSKIKEIDSRKKYYDIQDILTNAAKEAGIPRVWFDDNWGDRQ